MLDVQLTSLEDAAKELGTNLWTVRKAMELLNIQSKQNPINRRLRGLTRDDIQAIEKKIAQMTGLQKAD